MIRIPESATVMGGRVLALVAGATASVMTARYLQPAGRGEFFLAVTTAQLIAQFGNLGLPSANTYFVARDRDWTAALITNSLWIAFAAVPVIAVLALWSPLGALLGVTTMTRVFAIVVSPILVFTLLGSAMLVGLGRVGTYSAIQTLVSASALPFMLVAVWFHAGKGGFLLASLLGSLATAVALWRTLRRDADRSVRFRGDAFVATFRYSTKAYLATLAGFLILRINVFLLHAVAGPAAVGQYAVASQIADTLALVPQSIAVVLFPRLAASADKRMRTMGVHGAATAGLLAVMCAATWIAAEWGIRFAFGAAFAPAVAVLRVLLPGVFFLGVLAIVSQYLAASGFPTSVVAAWLVAVAVDAVLARALILRFGAVGAGIALSITYAGLLLVLIALSWRTEQRHATALEPMMGRA